MSATLAETLPCRLEQRDCLQVAGNLREIDRPQYDWQDAALWMRPSSLGNFDFSDRVAAAIERIGTQEDDEELAAFDCSSNAAIVFVARRQIFAVEEDVVLLGHKRESDRLDERAILRGIT